MTRILWRRIATALLVLPGLVTLLFAVFTLLGDPARMLAGQRGDAATLAAIRAELGLDQPWHVQYGRYLADLSPVATLDSAQRTSGNYHSIALWTFADASSLVLKTPYLRRSYQSGRPVWDLLVERLPATALLAVAALSLAILLGVGLGILAAIRAHSWWDRLASILSVLGVAAPSFFVAVLLLWLLAVQAYDWTGLNLGGYVRTGAIFHPGYDYHWPNLILPALTLGLRPAALLFQLTRSALLDALQTEYVRTAYSKGLTTLQVVWRHALPNALSLLLTAISGWFAALLTGAFFVEFIFDWPGIGKLTVDALFQNDYPVVLGSCLFTALLFLLVTLLVDLLYPLVDPRIRV